MTTRTRKITKMHTQSQTKEALQEAYRHLEQRVDELTALNHITQILVSTLELKTMLHRVSQELMRIFKASSTSIALLDQEKTELVIFSTSSTRDDIPDTVGATIPVVKNNPAFIQVLENQAPLIISHAQTDPLLESGQDLIRIRGVQHMMIIPLISHGDVLGTIAIDSDQPEREFTPPEVTLAETIAGQIANVIANAQLFKQEQHQRQIAESLREVSAVLSSSLDQNTVLRKILEQLQRVVPYDSAGLLFRDGDDLVVQAGAGIAETTVGNRIALSSENPGALIFKTGKSLVIADVHNNPSWAAWPEGDPVRGWVGTPLLIGEKPLGILTADSFEVGTYHDEDARIIQTFANQAAIAIHNAQLYQEIRREKQFFETLMFNSPVATILIDLDDRVTSWNPAAERLFGYTQNEAKGQRIDDLVARKHLHDEALAFTKKSQQGFPIRAITQRHRKNGRLVDVELLTVPVRIEGEIVAFLGLYHDITELQQARQEAETANRAKSRFLANMSHELRTPLTAVLGFSELLSHSQHIPPEEKAHIHTIHRNGEHLLILFNNLFELAKFETGNITLKKRNFNLYRLLDELKYVLSARADNEHLLLTFNRSSDVPQYIRSDEIKLHQVLLNLLIDILRFTSTGRVSLNIDFKKPLSDSQMSLPKSCLLFEIESHSYIATGDVENLLPISRQFVRLIGGEISISSSPIVSDEHSEHTQGRTVVFSFEIPVAVVELDAHEVQPAFFQNDSSEYGGLTEVEAAMDSVSPSTFADLPSELLDELEHAVITANMHKVAFLVDEIRAYNPDIAEILTRWNKNFEYAHILTIIRQAKELP